MLSMTVNATALTSKAAFAGAAPAAARPSARLSAPRRAVATQALFGKKEPKEAPKGKGKAAAKATEKYNGPMVCLECGYIATPQAYAFPLYRCGSCFAGKGRFEPAKAQKKKGLFGR